MSWSVGPALRGSVCPKCVSVHLSPFIWKSVSLGLCDPRKSLCGSLWLRTSGSSPRSAYGPVLVLPGDLWVESPGQCPSEGNRPAWIRSCSIPRPQEGPSAGGGGGVGSNVTLHVQGQVIRARKSPRAELAAEGALSRMFPVVAGQLV